MIARAVELVDVRFVLREALEFPIGVRRFST